MDVLSHGLEYKGMEGAWHGHGVACVNQTRPHRVNETEDELKTLSGRALQGNGMPCVNRPLTLIPLTWRIW